MPWFFLTFFLFFTFNNISEAKKLPSAVVVGTVYCDTCFQDDFLKNNHFISGATVAVECKDESSRFHQEVKTNENGKFKVNLPISISKHVRKIKKCSVKLVSSNEPYCSIASSATSSSLTLKSRKQGIHIFSAGFFSFKPEKQPNHCNKKPSFKTSKQFDSISDLSPIQDPTIPDLPPPVNQNPLPFLPSLPPLPKLPPLPPLPQLPYLPPLPEKISPTKEEKNSENLKKPQELSDPDFFFPTPPIFPPLIPNPLQPPPLIPNPFQPPPLIPNPLQPPPAPIVPQIPGFTPNPPAPMIPFPPIPGLTPSLPPPATFPPFPFPPLFPPTPPGVPPGDSDSSSSTLKKPSP